MLTLLLFIAVHQSLLIKKEEKLVALPVYSSFIRVATSAFRINPYSLVVVVVCAQKRSESRALHSISDITRLLAAEHVRKK